MSYDPHFGEAIDHPRSDEDDLAEKMFADIEKWRHQEWAEAKRLYYLPILEDKPPPELKFAATGELDFQPLEETVHQELIMAAE